METFEKKTDAPVSAPHEEKVDFTYPEGFRKAAAALDFLPEEQREPTLRRFISMAIRF